MNKVFLTTDHIKFLVELTVKGYKKMSYDNFGTFCMASEVGRFVKFDGEFVYITPKGKKLIEVIFSK